MSAILGKVSGGERIDRRAVCGKGRRRVKRPASNLNCFSVQTLFSLCLCGDPAIQTTETQRTQRLHREMLLTDPQRAHNMRALSKGIIGVVLVHT